MNPYNHLAYVTFGKKDGFQFFSKTGFIEKDPDLSYSLEAFAGIDLNKIIPPDHKGLMSVLCLKNKGSQYFFFGRFFPAKDAFNRPGYFGSAIILKDCYVRELSNMIANLEVLAFFAGACVAGQQAAYPELASLTPVPYPINFAFPGSSAKPLLIKVNPDKEYFLRMAFLGQFSEYASEVYFSEAPDLMENIDPDEFRVLSYEELIQEKHQQLLSAQKALETEIESLRDKSDGLSIELDKDRVYLAKLENDIKHKKAEYHDLLQSTERLSIKKSDLQNQLAFSEQQLKDSENKLIQIQENEQRWGKLLNEKIMANKQLEDDLKLIKAQKSLFEKNIIELEKAEKNILHSIEQLKLEKAALMQDIETFAQAAD